MTQERWPDVTIENRGGTFVLTPCTPAGRQWLEARAAAEHWTWVGNVVAVEGKPDAWPVVLSMLEAGLAIADTIRPCRAAVANRKWRVAALTGRRIAAFHAREVHRPARSEKATAMVAFGA